MPLNCSYCIAHCACACDFASLRLMASIITITNFLRALRSLTRRKLKIYCSQCSECNKCATSAHPIVCDMHTCARWWRGMVVDRLLWKLIFRSEGVRRPMIWIHFCSIQSNQVAITKKMWIVNFYHPRHARITISA